MGMAEFARSRVCGTWNPLSGRIARGSGENHSMAPSAMAIGKTPRR
jgi:hypothetical protein